MPARRLVRLGRAAPVLLALLLVATAVRPSAGMPLRQRADVAAIAAATGSIAVTHADGSVASPAPVGLVLGAGDRVATLDRSSATLSLPSGTTVELGAATTLVVRSLGGPDGVVLEAVVGSTVHRAAGTPAAAGYRVLAGDTVTVADGATFGHRAEAEGGVTVAVEACGAPDVAECVAFPYPDRMLGVGRKRTLSARGDLVEEKLGAGGSLFTAIADPAQEEQALGTSNPGRSTGSRRASEQPKPPQEKDPDKNQPDVVPATPAPFDPTILSVNATDDAVDAAPGDGRCATVDGRCTLRAAIMESNASAGPARTIRLKAGAYRLTLAPPDPEDDESVTHGDLDIERDVTIVGAGATSTTIDGNRTSRIFSIYEGTVLIADLAVVNGNSAEDGGGGGIVNGYGRVTLERVLVANNSTARESGSYYPGGGIYNGGFMTIRQSAIVNNDRTGIYNDYEGEMTIENTTVSRNVAEGIENEAAMAIVNATIVGNGRGGLEVSTFDPSRTTLRNTIIANNSVPPGLYDDCDIDTPEIGRIISLGNNLFGDATCGPPGPGDVRSADPRLGPLALNGGQTPSRALLPGSPAIDAGSRDACPSVDQRGDRRPRDGDGNGSAVCDIGAYEYDGSPVTVDPNTFTVDSTADAVDENPGDGRCRSAAGTCTLRAAVMEANELDGPRTIVLPPGIYALTLAGRLEFDARSGDLNVKANVSILGAGRDHTVVDGAGLDRIFDIGPRITVTVRGITLKNGSPGQHFAGAALTNRGHLTLSDIRVSDNRGSSAAIESYGWGAQPASLTIRGSIIERNSRAVSSDGGPLIMEDVVVRENRGRDSDSAIFAGRFGTASLTGVVVEGNSRGINSDGPLTVRRSIFVGNATSGEGGAIRATADLRLEDVIIARNTAALSGGGIIVGFWPSTEVAMTNVTLVGNSAGDSGGGALLFSPIIALNNVTISGNEAARDGGGLYAPHSRAHLTNVTIAENRAAGRGDALEGPFFGRPESVMELVNTIIVGRPGRACFGQFRSLGYNIENGNSCGLNGTGDQANTDPRLVPLGDNGGFTPTHALQPGSPAIDRGGDAFCPDVDQRGVGRPRDGDGNGSTVCDIGAFER
jgi:CSLREA domain-containing protein